MSEANRQDCPYCISTPCKCSKDELEIRWYEEQQLMMEYDEMNR